MFRAYSFMSYILRFTQVKHKKSTHSIRKNLLNMSMKSCEREIAESIFIFLFFVTVNIMKFSVYIFGFGFRSIDNFFFFFAEF